MENSTLKTPAILHPPPFFFKDRFALTLPTIVLGDKLDVSEKSDKTFCWLFYYGRTDIDRLLECNLDVVSYK